MLTFQQLFKLKGIRKSSQLLKPPIMNYGEFEFPKNSLLHWVTEDDKLAPLKSDIDHYDSIRHVYVDYVKTLATEVGLPRFVENHFNEKVRQFHSSHSDVYWLKKDPSLLIDQNSLIVESYTALRTQYKYQTVLQSIVDSFTNRYNTVFKRVNELAATERHQFIRITLPDVIPLRQKFVEGSKELLGNMGTSLIKQFNNEAKLFLLEVWKWVENDPTNTSLLEIINLENRRFFNILLQYKNKTVWLNLGEMAEWRFDPEEDRDVNTLSTNRYQLSLIMLFISLMKEDKIADKKKTLNKEVIAAFQAIQTDPEDSLIEEDEPDEDEKSNSADIETEDDLEKEISEHENSFSKLIALQDNADDLGQQAIDENGNPIIEEKIVNKIDVEPYISVEIDSVQQITNRARALAEQGVITIPELERYIKKARDFSKIPNPFGEGTLEEYMIIQENELVVNPVKMKDQSTVLDKSMLETTLLDFDKRYIEKILQKDTLNFISAIRNVGILITDVKVEKKEDILNSFYHYSVYVEVPGGKQTVLHMDIPIPDEYGVFLSGGVKYFLKKQHGDLPIRKVSKSRVSLTSYYGKLFIDVSQNISVNYDVWLNNRLQEIGLDPDDNSVTEMISSDCFYHKAHLPKSYTGLSQRFSHLTLKLKHPDNNGTSIIVKLQLDYTKRSDISIAAEALEKEMGKGSVLAGTFINGKDAGLVLFDKKSRMVLKGNKTIIIDSFEQALHLPLEKAPIGVATVNIFGTQIPIVLMLGYKMGMAKLLKTIGASYRIVPSGKSLNLQDNEFRVRFKNESWIFKKTDPSVVLIVGGLALLNRYLVNYDSDLFDKNEIYLNLLEELGAGVKVAKEFRVIFSMFVDHITKELLVAMKEPTDLILLLLRAVELLSEDYYPEDNDKNFMRIKGYERIAGTVYSELIRSIRTEERMLITAKPSLDINPKAVKLAILTDSSKDTYSEINPINCLKQQEIVTYGGTGGRKTQTMVKRTRKYNDTDIGVLSEANVDSGDVGINAYLSANPNFTTLRGTTKRFDSKTDSLTNLLSPSALMAPCSENDD